MKRLLHGGCRVLLVIFLGLSTSIPSTPAHAIDPSRCTTADLERMGEEATEEINQMIKNLEAEIASYQRMAGRVSLAEQMKLDSALKNLKDLDHLVEMSIRDEARNGPRPPAHGRRDPRVVLAELQAKVASEQESLTRLRSELGDIERSINFRRDQIRALREKLNQTINAFRDLISNPNNQSRRSIYETACRLKDASDADEVRDIVKPVREEAPFWKRFLPDTSRGARYEQGAEFDQRARSRFGCCFNAIAAVGGAIISLWPSDSAKAAESEAPSVNYPIRRGPYMPGDGDRGGPGAPLCPPEEPPVCAPSPYECPEEPQPRVVATATATATPAGGSSSSSSSSSSEGTVE